MTIQRSERRPSSRTARGAGTVLITRKVTFAAGHRYQNPAWSAARNREVFGACANPHGHGHNYELEVSLSGEIDPETGMVLNLRAVDEILRHEILERFDHRFINEEVEGFDCEVPTLENLCVRMWEILAPHFRDADCALHRLRLHESSDLYAEYFGPEDGAAPRQEAGRGGGREA